jgi:hypothetical protein
VRSSVSTCFLSFWSSINCFSSVRDEGGFGVISLDLLGTFEPVIIFDMSSPFDRPTAWRCPRRITTLYRRQCNVSRSLRLMSAIRVNSGTSPDPFNRSHDPGPRSLSQLPCAYRGDGKGRSAGAQGRTRRVRLEGRFCCPRTATFCGMDQKACASRTSPLYKAGAAGMANARA